MIEGDQQTVNDAARIRATGTPAIQVNTGKGCHLDAQMIADAAPRLPLADHGILFIENVGNWCVRRALTSANVIKWRCCR